MQSIKLEISVFYLPFYNYYIAIDNCKHLLLLYHIKYRSQQKYVLSYYHNNNKFLKNDFNNIKINSDKIMERN